MGNPKYAIGDRVGYEDMANPLRWGTVREIHDRGWGWQYAVEFEGGEVHWSDCLQRGWKKA